MKGAGLVALAVLLCAPAAVSAQEPTPAERAEQLNEAGRQRVRVLDLDGAAAKFRDAIELSPDPRYYFNLCYVLEKLGELREARAACQVVIDADTDAALEGKASGTLAAIDAALAAGEKAEEPAPARESDLEASSEPPAPIPVPPPPKRPLRVGVAAGLLSTTFSAEGADVSRQVGVLVGAELDARVAGPLSVVGGAGISRRGAKARIADMEGPLGVFGGSFDVSLTYVDVPILARVALGGDVAAVFDLGGAVSILVDDDATAEGVETVEAEPDLATFDVGAIAGVGLRVDAGATRVSLGVRYLHGLLDLRGDDGGGEAVYNRGFGAVATVSF